MALDVSGPRAAAPRQVDSQHGPGGISQQQPDLRGVLMGEQTLPDRAQTAAFNAVFGNVNLGDPNAAAQIGEKLKALGIQVGGRPPTAADINAAREKIVAALEKHHGNTMTDARTASLDDLLRRYEALPKEAQQASAGALTKPVPRASEQTAGDDGGRRMRGRTAAHPQAALVNPHRRS